MTDRRVDHATLVEADATRQRRSKVHATRGVTGRCRVLLGLVGDDGLGGEEKARDRRCVEQSGTSHLHRVVDTSGEHVDVLTGRGVEAVSGGQVAHAVGDNTGLEARVERDLLERSIHCDPNDVRAGRLVARQARERLALEGDLASLNQGNATTGNDALFDGSLGIAHGILDAVLALLELDLGCRSGLDNRDSTGKLCETLLELLAVVVAVGVLDLGADLLHATGDSVSVAGTFDAIARIGDKVYLIDWKSRAATSNHGAYEDEAAVRAKARELGIHLDDYPTYDRLANAVWEEIVEPHLVEPTFITDQPTWLTPLCKAHPEDPAKTLRFEAFIARMEVGNAYTELNDPALQRARFREQLEAEAAEDDEAGIVAGTIDEDYCAALDHGLPACGGQGIGIDRLVMLLSGSTSIRDVILFPTMKPLHAGQGLT